jgi:3-oxoacyl-[acyl-carrier-protein] synthase-1
MCVAAIREAITDVPSADWPRIPLLLCVAERERPGRLRGLEDALLAEIQHELGVEFSAESGIIPQGRVSLGIALMQARQILGEDRAPYILIAASDSLLHWPTLKVYESQRRLLTTGNSNGFMPGDGAGALLVGRDRGTRELLCTGLGFATEAAHIDSEEPLRGDGLTRAIEAALVDAGCEMQHLDLRIADLSGEQFYFKEATLAVSRIMRVLKEEFDVWHPAQSIGETGAVAGLAAVALAHAACHKGYADGPNILCHVGSDAGRRAAAVLRFRAG